MWKYPKHSNLYICRGCSVRALNTEQVQGIQPRYGLATSRCGMAQGLTAQQEAIAENPLLMGLHKEKRSQPFAMVILGAHGDLTKRKLLPALYALYLQQLLPQEFALLGTSRTKLTDEQFRSFMKAAVQEFASDLNFEEESWSRFAQNLHYLPADATKPDGFNSLKDRLDELASEHGTKGNNIFYLSTAPS